MKYLTQIGLGVAGAVLFLTFPGAVFSQDRVAGIIEEIHGPAYWRKDSRSKEVRLDPNRDKARVLKVGEQVRSGPKGRLRLFLCSGKIDAPRSWLTISMSQNCPNQAALEEYGRVGGRRRGRQESIYSPPDHGIVWPDQFVIRWIPHPAKCTASVTIKDFDDTSIFEEHNIEGSSGILNSDKMRNRLKQYRAQSGQGPLRLRMVDSCANDDLVTFSLLSAEAEKALKEELTRWDKQGGSIIVHVGRAFVFEQHGISAAAADEYEAALKIAPRSRHLILRTIEAHAVTGNHVRENELKRQLPAENDLP